MGVFIHTCGWGNVPESNEVRDVAGSGEGQRYHPGYQVLQRGKPTDRIRIHIDGADRFLLCDRVYFFFRDEHAEAVIQERLGLPVSAAEARELALETRIENEKLYRPRHGNITYIKPDWTIETCKMEKHVTNDEISTLVNALGSGGKVQLALQWALEGRTFTEFDLLVESAKEVA